MQTVSADELDFVRPHDWKLFEVAKSAAE